MQDKIEYAIDLAFKLLPSSVVGAILNTLLFINSNSQKSSLSVLLVQFTLSMFCGVCTGYLSILFWKGNAQASGYSMIAAIVGYKGIELMIDLILKLIQQKAKEYGNDKNNS